MINFYECNIAISIIFQKQPTEVFCEKRCSKKFRKNHRKTPVPESLFYKVSGLRPATLSKKRLRHRCFPVNFVKFLRTPFLQNTSGRLLLFTVSDISSDVISYNNFSLWILLWCLNTWIIDYNGCETWIRFLFSPKLLVIFIFVVKFWSIHNGFLNDLIMKPLSL